MMVIHIRSHRVAQQSARRILDRRHHIRAENRVQKSAHDWQGLVREGNRPAHHHHETEAHEQKQQRHHAVLDADDLVVAGEDIFLPEVQLVVMRVGMDIVMMSRVCRGVHYLALVEWMAARKTDRSVNHRKSWREN
jgi:hypothetical protein